jgi:hypothetical protein
MTEYFDGITEAWWDSLQEVLALVYPEVQQAMQALAEDEAKFIDFAGVDCVSNRGARDLRLHNLTAPHRPPHQIEVLGHLRDPTGHPSGSAR